MVQNLDGVLEHGGRYTPWLQAFTRLMSHHGRGRRPFPFCNDSDFGVQIQLGLHEGISTASIVDAVCMICPGFLLHTLDFI